MKTVDNSTTKYVPNMDKFSSVINRVYMELEASFLTLWESRPKSLISIVRVLYMVSTHFQKDGMEGNRGSLKDGAEAFALFQRGAQPVLRSSVLTIMNFNEVYGIHGEVCQGL